MAAETLTRDRVLDAAEETLRRFGPGKTTVVDVARALGVSHGTVYRHFASKAELLDAVLGRWLSRISAPLAAIADADNGAGAVADGGAGIGVGVGAGAGEIAGVGVIADADGGGGTGAERGGVGGVSGKGARSGEGGSAADRLYLWLTTLMRIKHEKARTDPDLFAAYALLRADMHAAIPQHVSELVGQLARIVASGMERGEFAAGDPLVAARAVWDATNRFHHPAHAEEWGVGADIGTDAGASVRATDVGASVSVGANLGAGTDGGMRAGAGSSTDAGARAGTGGGSIEGAFAAVWNLLLHGLSAR